MSENYELLRASRIDVELFRTKPEPEYDNASAPVYRSGNISAQAEIYKLVGRVFLADHQSTPRMVVFSSVEPRTNSNWLCSQVGEALATQVEGMVCLIDVNPFAPPMRRFLGINVGSNPEDASTQQSAGNSGAQSIHGSNLWLVSETISSAEAGIRHPDRLKRRLSELAEKFSYVLLSAPPVNESIDTLMLGRIADGVILVLEADSTRRAAALKARQSLDALNIHILGAVLDQRTYPIPEALYKRL